MLIRSQPTWRQLPQQRHTFFQGNCPCCGNIWVTFPGSSYDFPSTGVSSGSPAWTNPQNIDADDASDATITLTAGQTSGFLIGTGYTFNNGLAGTPELLDGMAIGGVESQAAGSATGTAAETFTTKMTLTLDGSTKTGDTRTKITAIGGGGSVSWLHNETGTGNTEQWGLAMLPADLLSANFGVIFEVTNNGANNMTINVSYIGVQAAAWKRACVDGQPQPHYWLLTTGAVTNGTCASCTSYAETGGILSSDRILFVSRRAFSSPDFVIACHWGKAHTGASICAGDNLPGYKWVLDTSGDPYVLYAVGEDTGLSAEQQLIPGTEVARYELAASSWNWEGTNVMSYIQDNGYCVWPATVSLAPDY